MHTQIAKWGNSLALLIPYLPVQALHQGDQGRGILAGHGLQGPGHLVHGLQ